MRLTATMGAGFELRDCPAWAEAELRKALTVPNPKYVQLGRLGKFRRYVPQTLCLLEKQGATALAPRGMDLRALLGAVDVRVDTQLRPMSLELHAELREYQRTCVEAAAQHHQGYVVAPTGAGKSVIGCALLARAGQRALVVVHTAELLSQWTRTIEKFLGVVPGAIGGGKAKPGEQITVAMVQTLTRRPELIDGYGTVLLDEMHHAPATTWAAALASSRAHYRYGLSATPERRDGMHVLLPLYFGGLLATVQREAVLDVGGVVPAEVYPISTGCWPDADEWGPMVSGLADDEPRTLRIAELACRAADKMATLVLTDRVAHAEQIARLCSMRHQVVLAHGQLPAAERRAALDAIRAGAQLTVATTGILGEGVDVAGWQALILALPMSGKGSRLAQAVGRVVRPAPGKTIAHVVDLVDEHPLALGAWKGRKTRYRKQGIAIKEKAAC